MPCINTAVSTSSYCSMGAISSCAWFRCRLQHSALRAVLHCLHLEPSIVNDCINLENVSFGKCQLNYCTSTGVRTVTGSVGTTSTTGTIAVAGCAHVFLFVRIVVTSGS